MNIHVSNEILPLGMIMLSLQFSAKTQFSQDTYVSCYFVNHMQVRNLRNRLRVNMVCEGAWVSVSGERDLPKSLNWCSRLEIRSHAQVRTYARTHTGKRAHLLLITMALKQKQSRCTVTAHTK